jgi:hypothetical protein
MKTQTTQSSNKFSVIIKFTLSFLALLLCTSNIKAQSTGSSTVNFIGVDAATQGNWQGKYGADGYAIANGTQALPSYAVFTPLNQSNYTWNANTTDPRALQTVSPAGRVASCWYGSTFSLGVNLTDGKSHQVAIYALDWDGNFGRSETVQVLDANTNAALDSRTVSSFSNGMYLVWNITGNVRINVTTNAGANAVISGAFFGTGTSAPTATPAASSSTTTTTGAVSSFVGMDTSTQGNWQGKYGSDGYAIANSNQSLPSYAAFSPMNQSNFTWSASTTDPRAPQTVTPAGRVASTWYSSTTFSLNVNLTDGKSHQVAVYALDWDGNFGRSETVQVVDANSNAVLDTRSVSSFSNGMYLVWNVTGHVRINVTMNAGANAVISGIFFSTNGTPVAPAATSQPVSQPVVTPKLTLTSSASSVSFGSVTQSTSNAQTLTLTNTGTGAVTISSTSVSGAGFNASGIPFGTILAPGQAASLTATFSPAGTGSVSGSISVSSNATNGAIVIALSGTGTAPVSHAVSLSWSPSTSTVVGYNVYVSTVSGSGYQKLTSSPVPVVSYTDAGLQTAQTRYYVITSVDSNNNESGYSTQVSAIVP